MAHVLDEKSHTIYSRAQDIMPLTGLICYGGVAEILFSLNPSILYQEASSPKNVWFSTSAVDKHYKKLSESLYFCPTKSSTWNKMAILKNLFKLYQIDEDELTFGLVPSRTDMDEFE